MEKAKYPNGKPSSWKENEEENRYFMKWLLIRKKWKMYEGRYREGWEWGHSLQLPQKGL